MKYLVNHAAAPVDAQAGAAGGLALAAALAAIPTDANFQQSNRPLI